MVGEVVQRWFQKLPDRWAIEQRIARQFMDECETGFEVDGQVFIRGTFPLRLPSGHELDRFRLRLVYPAAFPKRGSHPAVHLESHHHAWKNTRDSHIEESWKLCLFVPIESGLDFENDQELTNLFPHIHTFLLLEREYQRRLQADSATARWPGPQRSHGPAGVEEALRARGKKMGRNDACWCGSGKKYKKCCIERFKSKEAR